MAHCILFSEGQKILFSLQEDFKSAQLIHLQNRNLKSSQFSFLSCQN